MVSYNISVNYDMFVNIMLVKHALTVNTIS